MNLKLSSCLKYLVISSAIVPFLTGCKDSVFTGNSKKSPSQTDIEEQPEQNQTDIAEPATTLDERLRQIESSKLFANCETALAKGSLQQASTVLKFEENDGTAHECRWLAEQRGGVIAGVKTWVKTLEVPSGRTLCGLELKTDQQFRYDDTLIFSLNKRLLFWGNLVVTRLEKKGKFYHYDFSRLYDNRGNRQSDCTEGTTACLIPDTQKLDAFNVAFDKITGYDLALDILNRGGQFELTITGDNDPEIDCTHTGLELTVSYTYTD